MIDIINVHYHIMLYVQRQEQKHLTHLWLMRIIAILKPTAVKLAVKL